MTERRSTDATRLSFPLQLVILIVCTVATGLGANYASQNSVRQDQAAIRSDVRDILTRLELSRDINKAQSEASKAEMAALKSAVEAVSKKQELQALQIAEFSRMIAERQTGRK